MCVPWTRDKEGEGDQFDPPIKFKLAQNMLNSRKVSSGSSDDIAAIANKLDSLGRDMKKLKENVHDIQVGCKTCGGAHLDKNSDRYRVGLPGYYTRVDNHPPFSEKMPNLKELMNKHLEESTRRRADIEDWMKKHQESTYMNIRNQNASVKNLEKQVEKMTKDYQAKTANEVPNPLIGQHKVVFTDNEASRDETSYNGTNELHEVSFISDDNMQERRGTSWTTYGKSVNKSMREQCTRGTMIDLKKNKDWVRVSHGKEENTNTKEDCEDLENFGEKKIELILDAMLDKLDNELFTETINNEFPYGTVELSQANGPNFKVNGHRVKYYFGGNVPHLVVPDLQTFPKDQ
ncbi:hypothetical protein Tco_0578969 [Tanacetum coccineum]